MEWFKRHNTRQDLFRTHTGQALIRSICRQAVSVESSRGETTTNSPEQLRAPPTPEEEEDDKVADHVVDNPFLKNYARIIDSLHVSSLPPDIDNDIVVHMVDDKTATVSVDTMGIKLAVVGGKLCVYPREDLGENLKCGSEGQQKAIFLTNLTNKWSHGCNTSFEIIRDNIIMQPNHRKQTASVKNLRAALSLKPDQKINIEHVFNYVFYY